MECSRELLRLEYIMIKNWCKISLKLMDFIESNIQNTKTKIESIKINICWQINNPIFYLIFVSTIYSETLGLFSKTEKSNAKKRHRYSQFTNGFFSCIVSFELNAVKCGQKITIETKNESFLFFFFSKFQDEVMRNRLQVKRK